MCAPQFIGSQYFAMSGLDGPTYFTTGVRPYAFWVFEWAVSALHSPYPTIVTANTCMLLEPGNLGMPSVLTACPWANPNGCG